jgi:D-alanyl-D-alanine carboxypeptidase/D-alanyl-D-alanine-endopeptidase (penicillin-binding protein 4)
LSNRSPRVAREAGVSRGERFRAAIAVAVVAVLTTRAAAEDTRAAIDRLLAGVPTGKIGVRVVSLDGVELFARDADRALVPASLEKLVLAVAARERLGRGFRFQTTLRADGKRDGASLSGDLFLVGGGDPGLTADHVEKLARTLVDAGITTVTGDLVADESFFDGERYDPTWGAMASTEHLAPLSALSVDGNRMGGRFVADPVALAQATFRARAKRAGLAILGKDRSGVAPPSAETLARVSSPTLPTFLSRVLAESDNFAAEMLLRTLGAVVRGAPGSREKGVGAVRETLALHGADARGLTLHDGSGRSRVNRLSARLLTDVLVAGTRDPAARVDLIDALPVAGKEGTLRDRFVDKKIPGVLMAKTGSLRDATGMAGLFWTPAGDGFAFAVMMNAYLPRLFDADAMRFQEELVLLLMRRAAE